MEPPPAMETNGSDGLHFHPETQTTHGTTPWIAGYTDEGFLYWYNTVTGSSQWEAPAELSAEEADYLIGGGGSWHSASAGSAAASETDVSTHEWVLVRSKTSAKPYYYNRLTGESYWPPKTPTSVRNASSEAASPASGQDMAEVIRHFREERRNAESIWSARLQDKERELERLEDKWREDRERLEAELALLRTRQRLRPWRRETPVAAGIAPCLERYENRMRQRDVHPGVVVMSLGGASTQTSPYEESLRAQAEEFERRLEARDRDWEARVDALEARHSDAKLAWEQEQTATQASQQQWESRLESCKREYEEKLESQRRVFERELQEDRDRHARLREEREQWQEQLRELRDRADDLERSLASAQASATLANEKWREERSRRRVLHNQMIELQGNIRVFARVRPTLPQEARLGDGGVEVVDCVDEERLTVRHSSRGGERAQPFTFDGIFGPTARQQDVYAEIRPLVQSLLDGYSVCIFAYGQTGSGKTHTMEGADEGSPGVNRLALRDLFELRKQRLEEYGENCTLSLSVLEVHNDDIRDLLTGVSDDVGVTSGSGAAPEPRRCAVRTNPDGTTYIEFLTSFAVDSVEQVEFALRVAKSRRAVGAHSLNEHSSRSHLVVTVHARTEASSGNVLESKLNLIDLAACARGQIFATGSERIAKTDATGERLREAQFINKSLSALGNVMEALSQLQEGQRKGTHVPFRDSKLTFLLQDSLSRGSKVAMFVNVSPSRSNAPETLCSLRFAERCRAVQLGQAQRRVTAGSSPASGSPRTPRKRP